jgi:uncharacterized membrane protein HdeD (DUF308 family)
MSFTGVDGPNTNLHSAALEFGLDTTLSRNWWAVALRGVFGIAFGLIAFLFPGATMLSLVVVFSVYLVFDGVVAIISAMRAARHHERWGLLTIEGFVSILVAILAASWPGLTVFVFVIMVAGWAIATGVLMFAAAFKLNKDHGRWWLAIGGIVSILYGVLLIAAPLLGALVLTWWIGAYAIVFGVSLLALAFQLRARHKDRETATIGTRG